MNALCKPCPVCALQTPAGVSRRGAAPPGRSSSASLSGLTLIEMVGVLAVMSILAALAFPALIRQVDRANTTREKAQLAMLSDALTRSVTRTKSVPAAAGIPAALAAEANLALAQITATYSGTPRVFLVDPAAAVGAGLPYTQTNNAGLPAPPTGARVLMFSSLSTVNPLTTAETANSAANFNDIWNTPQNTKPSGWIGWKGTSDDLRIQRVNLGPLFHRLVLVNHDPSDLPQFSIGANPAPTNVPTSPIWDAYYLDGSVISLYAGTNLQTQHLLTADISFVFETQAWRGTVERGATTSSLVDSFAQSADQFLSAATNPASKQGASQLAVLIALSSFMDNYTTWADQCPHFPYHGNKPTNNPGNVPEYQMLNAFGTKNGFVDTFSGSGGLLK